MNPDLIPSYDMLGLPAPAWLVQVLMAFTLALHWLLIGGVVGGSVVVLVNAIRARKESDLAELNRTVVPFFPFLLSMAMTVGVAPLLFVQVLYGQFFYTANILLGFWWLGLLGVVLALFALLWTGWRRAKAGRRVGLVIPAVALILLALGTKILASNATLMQSPEVWEAVRAHGMNRFYGGDATFIPRVLFALAGFVAAGGMVMAVLSRLAPLYGREADPRGVSAGFGVALPALIAQLAFGIWLVIALPAAQRTAVLAGGFEAVCFYIAVLAFLAAVPLVILARKAEAAFRIALPLVVYFAGLFSLAAARDMARRAALDPVYKLADVPVHPEWSSFLFFLVFFLGAIGIIAWLLKLARTPRLAC